MRQPISVQDDSTACFSGGRTLVMRQPSITRSSVAPAVGLALLASERRSLLDSRAARALPRLMLVTRHEHRGVLNNLKQAHLYAARQAQHGN
jgi:hypothetical protein